MNLRALGMSPTPLPIRTSVAPAKAEEPVDGSILSRAARGLHRGVVSGLGWAVGSVVGLAGFVGNLAPGAWLGLRRALGDDSYSQFDTRCRRSERWEISKFAQTAVLGAAGALMVGVHPVLGAVVGAALRGPMHAVSSHHGLAYEMGMQVEAKVERGSVLAGTAKGALVAAVTGWKAGLNGVRATLSGLAGTAEARERGPRLLYHDMACEMSPEGRADAVRRDLQAPGLDHGRRALLLGRAMKHTEAIYESRNSFMSCDDQRRITLSAWAGGLRASGAAARALPGSDEDLLALHRTLTERLDAGRAWPAFERFLIRRADSEAPLERALEDYQQALPRILAGESVDSATLDRDSRAVLGLERPEGRPEVVPEAERVKLGDVWLPVRA